MVKMHNGRYHLPHLFIVISLFEKKQKRNTSTKDIVFSEKVKRNIKYCTITGGRSARGGDVDPASAVGGVHISLLRELLVRYVPFAVDISLREVTPVKMRVELLSYHYRHSPPDWAQQEPVPHVVGRLEVPCSQDQHLVQVNVLVVVCLHHKLGL